MPPTPSPNKIYLLRDAVKGLTIAAQQDKNVPRHERASLYEGNVGQLKSYPDEKYDYKQLRSIQQVFEDATKGLVGHHSQLDLGITYDTFRESFKIHVTLSLGEFFISKITKNLERPVISMSGTLTANYLKGQQIENQSGHEISVAEIFVKDTKTSVYFKGGTIMEEFCNKATHGTEFVLKFSITLEWMTAKNKTLKCLESEPSFNCLEKLLQEKTFSDCCIVASNQEEVSCHRSILAVHSDVLHAMLSSDFTESQSGRIEMTDVSEDGVKALLAYLYKNELNAEEMSEEVAFDLLHAAHKYNIQMLEKVMVKLLFNKPPEWFSLSNVLTLYFFTVKVEEYETLCDKMMAILKKNSKELRSVTAYRDLMEKNPNEAFELAFKLLEL